MGQIGGGLHLAASFLLLGIGLANINVEPYHFYVSVGFFVTLPLSALFIGYFCYRKKMRVYTLLAWGTAVLAAVIWLLPWGAVAIPEALSVTIPQTASTFLWQTVPGCSSDSPEQSPSFASTLKLSAWTEPIH